MSHCQKAVDRVQRRAVGDGDWSSIVLPKLGSRRNGDGADGSTLLLGLSGRAGQMTRSWRGVGIPLPKLLRVKACERGGWLHQSRGSDNLRGQQDAAGARGSNGRERVVLDLASDLLSARDAAKASYEVEGHVDARADAGAGDEVAVVDEA